MKTDANTSRSCRNLKAALTLALPVLAGPASTQEVRVERVGQRPGSLRGPASAVAVAGQYAYVAVGLAGLQMVDMSDPANPRRVGGYRTKVREELTARAKEAAEKVRRWGDVVELEPMNAFERHLIHQALKDDPTIETHSVEVEGSSKKAIVLRPRR